MGEQTSAAGHHENMQLAAPATTCQQAVMERYMHIVVKAHDRKTLARPQEVSKVQANVIDHR